MDKLKVGDKISHPVYGNGVVLDAWIGNKITKHRAPGGPLFTTRVIDHTAKNYAIRFEHGGPVGWAARSTNDPEALTLV
jgi:hypothetical protein